MKSLVIHNREVTPESLLQNLAYKRDIWRINDIIQKNHLNLNTKVILERTPSTKNCLSTFLDKILKRFRLGRYHNTVRMASR